MGQSRLMSLLESSADIATGFIVSVLAAHLIFPIFGVNTTIQDNLGIVALFTLTSLGRRYVTRRLFNWLHVRGAQ